MAGHRAGHEPDRDAGVKARSVDVGVLVFILGVALPLAGPGLVRDVGPGDGEQVRAERDDPEEDGIVPRDARLQRGLAPQTVEHAVCVVQDDRHVVEEPALKERRHEAGEQVPEQRGVRGPAVVVLGVFLAERLPVHGKHRDDRRVAEPDAKLDEPPRVHPVRLLAALLVERLELAPIYISRFRQRRHLHRHGLALAAPAALQPR